MDKAAPELAAKKAAAAHRESKDFGVQPEPKAPANPTAVDGDGGAVDLVTGERPEGSKPTGYELAVEADVVPAEVRDEAQRTCPPKTGPFLT